MDFRGGGGFMAKIRVGINGFGRIGRNVLRACLGDEALDFVAVNDITDAKTLAHLLKHDSVHGALREQVRAEDDRIAVGTRMIRVLAERDPGKLPWKSLGVELVLECSGLFTDRAKAAKHLEAGARKVTISPPSKDAGVDLTAELEKPATEDAVNAAMREAAGGKLKGILHYCEEPLVSADFNGMPYSSIFDSKLTRVLDKTFCKVLSWYDNEWGFSMRMRDVASLVGRSLA